jgi:alanine-glyoxylate transaminase/serine-glyoxylate transaminase/serine-pyruvate transaminase
MEDVKKGLRYIFQTENPWTLPLSGSGSAAIDAVMDNMIEPGDIVLIPSYGLWSTRAADIAERLGTFF